MVFNFHSILVFFYLCPSQIRNLLQKFSIYQSFPIITRLRTEKMLLVKFEILGLDVSNFSQQRPRAGSQTAIIRGSQQYIGGIKVGALWFNIPLIDPSFAHMWIDNKMLFLVRLCRMGHSVLLFYANQLSDFKERSSIIHKIILM